MRSLCKIVSLSVVTKHREEGRSINLWQDLLAKLEMKGLKFCSIPFTCRRFFRVDCLMKERALGGWERNEERKMGL